MVNKIGKYRVFAPLHITTFSDIFVCRDPDLDVDVTIKVLNVKYDRLEGAVPDIDEYRRRFLHEAKVMARLDDLHLVPIREYAVSEDGTPYIVMPYYPATLKYEIGHDTAEPEKLRRLPPSRRPHAIGVDRALSLWCQVLKGLAALHQYGLVHRDVKPGNVFLTAKKNGTAKLGDFGMVKVPNLDDDLGTQFYGTEGYASPEQTLLAADVDARSDIYSSAVMTCRMLSGAILKDHTMSVTEAAANVPDEIAALIDLCRSEDPAGRPANARAVLEVLESFQIIS